MSSVHSLYLEIFIPLIKNTFLQKNFSNCSYLNLVEQTCDIDVYYWHPPLHTTDFPEERVEALSAGDHFPDGDRHPVVSGAKASQHPYKYQQHALAFAGFRSEPGCPRGKSFATSLQIPAACIAICRI